jgi:hypothetical protein
MDLGPKLQQTEEIRNYAQPLALIPVPTVDGGMGL